MDSPKSSRKRITYGKGGRRHMVDPSFDSEIVTPEENLQSEHRDSPFSKLKAYDVAVEPSVQDELPNLIETAKTFSEYNSSLVGARSKSGVDSRIRRTNAEKEKRRQRSQRDLVSANATREVNESLRSVRSTKRLRLERQVDNVDKNIMEEFDLSIKAVESSHEAKREPFESRRDLSTPALHLDPDLHEDNCRDEARFALVSNEKSDVDETKKYAAAGDVPALDKKRHSNRNESVMSSSPEEMSQRPDAGPTTPRQRDLWDRLLGESSPSRSKEMMRGANLNKSDQSPDTRSANNDSGRPFRPRRLIDAFHDSSAFKGHANLNDRTIVPRSNKEARAIVNSGGDPIENKASASSPGVSPAAELSDRHNQRLPRKNEHKAQADKALGGSRHPPKVTYAQHRSYLSGELGDLMETQDTNSLDAYDILNIDPSTDVKDRTESIDDQTPVVTTMRSAHELREAGIIARSSSEIDTMMDELSHPTLNMSSFRSVLLRLCFKLQDEANCRLFVDKAFTDRLTTSLKSCSDLFSLVLVVMIHLEVLETLGSSTLSSMVDFASLASRLEPLLVQEEDVEKYFKSRDLNVSKNHRHTFSMLLDELSRKIPWPGMKPTYLSSQYLVLRFLEHIARNKGDHKIASELFISLSLNPFRGQLSPERKNVRGLNLLLEASLSTALKVVELIVADGMLVSEEIWLNPILPCIRSIITSTDYSSKGHEHIQIPALQICLTMTTNMPEFCHTLINQAVAGSLCNIVTSFFQGHPSVAANEINQSINRVILALGCLMKLAEESEAIRALMLEPFDETMSMLDRLMTIFQKKQGEAREVLSEAESASNVPYGYLCVLLCLLCLSPPLKVHLAMGSNAPSFVPLLGAAEEFLIYFEKVGISDVDSKFLDRLRCHIADLRQYSLTL